MERSNLFKTYFLLVLSFFFLPFFLFGELGSEKFSAEGAKKAVVPSHPFFLVTIPKSGTHLMTKLLMMLSNRKPDALHSIVNQLPNLNFGAFETRVLKSWIRGSFPYQHTGNFAAPFIAFSERHPDYRKIVMIRDLRDLLVSLTFHHEKELEKELGGKVPFSEKLTHILTGKAARGKSIRKGIEAAIALKDKGFHICRFEDFVGAKGGGKEKVQRQEVARLATYLGIELEPTQLEWITENLFGNSNGPKVSGTFRKGKIGSWKKHFTEEHVTLFRQSWSDLQKTLGYPNP